MWKNNSQKESKTIYHREDRLYNQIQTKTDCPTDSNRQHKTACNLDKRRISHRLQQLISKNKPSTLN
jgi:hypothetical protein